jgi:DNA-binding NarL/FixJ family response regulator
VGYESYGWHLVNHSRPDCGTPTRAGQGMAPEAADRPPAVVHRLHAARLLLVSDDGCFRGATSLRLERNGYAVMATGHAAPMRLAELAREHRADVVLIDEAPSRRRAARTVAALDLLYPRGRSLILCAEDGRLSLASASQVSRSSPIAELRAAVERCYAGERPHAAH